MVFFWTFSGVAIAIDPLYLVIRLMKNPISSAARTTCSECEQSQIYRALQPGLKRLSNRWED